MTILRIKNEGYWRITVGKRYLSWNPTNTFAVIPWGKRGRFWYWLHFCLDSRRIPGNWA